MNQNVGMTDKLIRVLVAIAGAVLGYYISPWFYLVSIIALITAATGFCGLYSLLGINTCKACAKPAVKEAPKAAAKPAEIAAPKKPAKKRSAKKKR